MNDPLDSAIPVGSGSGTTVPPRTTPPPPTSVPPSAAARCTPSGSDKIWAILCHVSEFIAVPFLLPLIVYLAMKGESAYVADNAKEALNFHLSLLIYGLGCALLAFTLIGAPLAALIGAALVLGSIILSIIAAMKCSDGEIYRYPWTLRLIR
jgi:uncharacterized Tic20 family protein